MLFTHASDVAVVIDPRQRGSNPKISNLANMLHRAQHEVLVLAYGFTSQPITDALIDAHHRGVRVSAVLDHSNEKEAHTELPRLLGSGLETLIDAHHAIAHNKVIVIDGATVITGSFNFTHQAEIENAENLLILDGLPELARQFHANFH